ncbi:MAG: ATPase [Bacteroidetes bacterium]|nr:MAG: ATPase [Bacteroidota bacterium]
MDNNFQMSFVVEQPASKLFNAINNVTQWWNENLKGESKELNDEFEVQFSDDVHYSKQKLIELVPNKKVVWLVTDSKLSWLKNKHEWTGTKIVFEIFDHPKGTALKFTHIGLNPETECYKDCSNGWRQYINSLYKLISTGKGEPEKVKIYE